MDGNLSEVFITPLSSGFAISEYLLIIITLTLFMCKINVLAKSACSTERYWHRADLSVCDLMNCIPVNTWHRNSTMNVKH